MKKIYDIMFTKGSEKMDDFNLNNFSNEQLYELLYKEILFYSEDLYSLSKIILKQLPKKI